MKGTDFLMFITVIAVVLASVNLIITINKIGDFKTMVGLVTDTGTANLTIASNTNITFILENIDWGSGFVLGSSCELNTTGGMGCSGFNTIDYGLQLENNGNSDVTLNLTTDKGADAFLGGVSPIFQWNVSNNGTDTEVCPPIYEFTSWTNVFNWTGGNLTCSNFTWREGSDTIRIDLRVVIPQTATINAKGVVITAEALAI